MNKLVRYLKGMLCLMTIVIGSPTFAEEISGERIAELLASSKTAPCLAELYKLEENSELYALTYNFSANFDDAAKILTSTIVYNVIPKINSVDARAGEAKIKVFALMIENSDSPGTYNSHPLVTGCEFEFVND